MDELKQFLKNNRQKLDSHTMTPDGWEELSERIKSKVVLNRARRIRLVRFYALAASLVISVFAGIIFLSKRRFTEPIELTKVNAKKMSDTAGFSIASHQNRIVVRDKIVNVELREVKQLRRKLSNPKEDGFNREYTEIDQQIEEALSSSIWQQNQECYQILKNQYSTIKLTSENITRALADENIENISVDFYKIINQQKLFLLGQIHDQGLKTRLYASL